VTLGAATALIGVALGAALSLLANLVVQRSAHGHDARQRALEAIRDMRRERIAPLFNLVREMEEALAYRAQDSLFKQAMASSNAAKLIPEDRRQELEAYLRTYMMQGVKQNEAAVSFPMRVLSLVPRVNDRHIGDALVEVAFSLLALGDFDVGECAMKLVDVHERLERYVADAP
jgi:hypothetical protein